MREGTIKRYEGQVVHPRAKADLLDDVRLKSQKRAIITIGSASYNLSMWLRGGLYNKGNQDSYYLIGTPLPGPTAKTFGI